MIEWLRGLSSVCKEIEWSTALVGMIMFALANPMTWVLLLLAFTVGYCSAAEADAIDDYVKDRRQWSAYIGSDWTHGTGTPGQRKYGEIRYEEGFNDSAFGWGVSVGYRGSWLSACGELNVNGEKWYAGFGICRKEEGDDKVAGQTEYQIRAGRWINRRLAVEYLHISNCRYAFNDIANDWCLIPGFPRGGAPNDDYNFVGLRIKLGK